MDTLCPNCRSTISTDFYFCPFCGKKIKEPPPSVSISSQFVVYFVSLFIPPFGLWYAYKYLRYGGDPQKKVGYAAIVLTVIGIWLAVWATQVMINDLNQALGLTGL